MAGLIFIHNSSNTSIFTLSHAYYSAWVPEMVNSFRSVSEIIISVLRYILVFTVLSILVLIFNPKVWRSLILACTSPCRFDSRKMSSERLSLWYSPLLFYYISLHTIYYQEEITQCLVISNYFVCHCIYINWYNKFAEASNDVHMFLRDSRVIQWFPQDGFVCPVDFLPVFKTLHKCLIPIPITI